ncbi:MAG: hypothetical protein JJT81_04585 [Rubellimicrobium sp.]|nr:hypothetical protein [Rubellimicrobium sp.]
MVRSLPPVAAFPLCLMLAACGDVAAWPEVDLPPPDDGAAFPALVPLEPVLAAAAALPQAPPTADMSARQSALEARAAALRAPVIPPDARDRLGGGDGGPDFP